MSCRLPDTSVARWLRDGQANIWILEILRVGVTRVYAELDENGFPDFVIREGGEYHFSNLRGAQKYVEDLIWPDACLSAPEKSQTVSLAGSSDQEEEAEREVE